MVTDALINEVGPRDGLQATPVMMATSAKLQWIEALAAAGLQKIQVGSFVPPKLLPQMADSAEVVQGARKIGGFEVAALVPNLKGAELALAAGAQELDFVLSASEPHNLANVRRTHEQSLAEFRKVAAMLRDNPDYADVRLSGGLATCFGCSIAGKVDEKIVYGLVEQLIEAGADRIGIADTVGYGGPQAVRRIFTEVLDIAGELPVGAHFHDTRGMGIANAFAAYDAGVRQFDGCLGGLGGCPYAPGATGNVVTEDMVFLFESMGVRTGISFDGLRAAREIMEQHLNGEPTHGQVHRAGLPVGFEKVA